jgi:hypothetical protein
MNFPLVQSLCQLQQGGNCLNGGAHLGWLSTTIVILQEGLPGRPGKASGNSKHQQQQQRLAVVEDAARKNKKKAQKTGDVLMVPLSTATGGIPGSTEQEAAAAAGFIPSPRFSGVKPGYVFKKGPQGLGFYRDVAAAASHGPTRAHSAAQHTSQQQQQQLLLPQRQQQSSSKRQQKDVKAQKKQSRSSQGAAPLPLLPGLAKKKQRDTWPDVLDGGHDTEGSVPVDGGLASDEGTQWRGGPLQSRLEAKGHRKALPGRLRKKLAGQKAKMVA